MTLQPLVSDCPAIVYLDFKSPYAYLAVEPTRELDVENSAVIQHLLDQVGANGTAFIEWGRAEGAAMNAQLQSSAFSAGIFGVPTYVVGTELYFGREHLPRIRWQLTDQPGSAPDIGNPLPAKPTVDNDGSRSALHKQWREKNRLRNLERYNSTGAESGNYDSAIAQLLQQNQITPKTEGPEQVIRPAMPGIVVLLGDELFIGRQHLPLITARLK